MALVRRSLSASGVALLVGAALAVIVRTPPSASVAEQCIPADLSAAHVCRGDQVEARYQGYRERLERFFGRLGAVLEKEAPDLYTALREAPPAAVPYGYQILPKLVPDVPPAGRLSRLPTGSWGWPRTEAFIDRDLGRLATLEARLGRSAQMKDEDLRGEYEKMVAEYKTLAANQKVIASHIQYNRLWQGEITRYRPFYDRQTALYDAVLARQALLEVPSTGDPVLEADLRARQEALSRQISVARRKIAPPEFVRVEHPSPHHWMVRVLLYTDIEDRSFVERFQVAVENAWRVRDGDDEFSVAVEIRHVPASQLYPGGDVPARGAHIDPEQHIGRFPPDGAVLTTGAKTLHVLGRSINLGPQDIPPSVFAHEFGHILGFQDGYVRGYRDRGPEGYEVLEVVPDPEDIMSAPGAGHVSRYHFQQILDARAGR